MTRLLDWTGRRKRQATHTALLYSGEQEYLDGVREFIDTADRAGSPIVVASDRAGLERLRNKLNGHAERVEFLDMTDLGSNPARIIPAIRAAIDAHAGNTLYFLGEPLLADRSLEEIGESMRHEMLLNQAFSSTPVEILCPYDLSAVDATVIADAERAHPFLCDSAGRHPSHAYKARGLPRCCQAPLSPPPRESVSLRFELADLARVRALVSEQAARAGLTVGQCGDMVLAADEVATNSIRHGGGGGLLRCWHEPGRLTCEVSDSGHISDPLAGRIRPPIGAHDGRGLWMVNQLCELVQIRTGSNGTTVRLHARRHSPDRAGQELIAA